MPQRNVKFISTEEELNAAIGATGRPKVVLFEDPSITQLSGVFVNDYRKFFPAMVHDYSHCCDFYKVDLSISPDIRKIYSGSAIGADMRFYDTSGKLSAEVSGFEMYRPKQSAMIDSDDDIELTKEQQQEIEKAHVEQMNPVERELYRYANPGAEITETSSNNSPTALNK